MTHHLHARAPMLLATVLNLLLAVPLLAADSDGDGIDDAVDLCPNTIPGAAVDATGCPQAYLGDWDRDGDVDADDLAALSSCRSGPAVPRSPECAFADLDQDNDVDQDDFGLFQRCYSGANQIAGNDCLRIIATTTAVSGQEDDGVPNSSAGVTLSVALDGVDRQYGTATLQASITALPAAGQLSQFDGTSISTVPAIVADAQRRVLFSAPGNANGIPYASFHYAIASSVDGAYGLGSVSVTITPVNDPPVSCSQRGPLGNSVQQAVITLCASDVDSSSLIYCITQFPTHGQLRDAANQPLTPANNCTRNGLINYLRVPPVHFGCNPADDGPTNVLDFDFFRWFVSDAQDGVSDIATVTFDLFYADLPPIASDQTFTGAENQILQCILNATDPEGDKPIFIVQSLPQHGLLVFQGLDITPALLPFTLGAVSLPELTYVPDLDFNTSETAEGFNVTVTDGLLTRDCIYHINLVITPAGTPAQQTHAPAVR